MGVVSGNIGMGAVIHIEARIQSFERYGFGFSGGDIREYCSATGTGNCVKVDVVMVNARRMVFQRQLNSVSFTNAEERSRHCAVECSVVKRNARGHFSYDFLGFQFNFHYLWRSARDW